jgi:6-phosphogluconolactonase
MLAESKMLWEKTHLFWGDERCVSPTDPRSNYRLVVDALLSRASVPPQNVHAVPVEIDSPEAAAQAYARELRGFFRGEPSFDVNLLGMGPDGHTASLFPGAASLDCVDRWALGVDGSQGDPPVPRVTLTLPAINASKTALFLISGGKKLPLVEKIVAGDVSYPAGRVSPREGLAWLVCP